MRRATLALAIVLAPVLTAAETVEELLGLRGTGPVGGVAVVAWTERVAQGHELVVELQATGDARLVADPGILLHPEPGRGARWQRNEPVEHRDAALAYFDGPQQLRLPFETTGAGELAARVEYAYCFTAEICLFGEDRVVVTAPGS